MVVRSMDENRPRGKRFARMVRAARGGASATNRPARQPTRALIVGLLWIVFMLVVWFQAPGVRLPTFFQRLVGIAAALLTMLVVMFAIREYGKRYNRVPLPLVGRVNTSRVAGGLVFLAVLAWWMSPWAPIPAGEPEPDLWGLLEEGLNQPLLQVVDTNLAVLVRPAPSAEARQAARAFAPHADPFRRALMAIAASRFDEAESMLRQAGGGSAADRVQQAFAQLDLYRGNFAEATRVYIEMLKIEPRREDFLAHGALASALAGDYPTATAWAEQLLNQARARARYSPRTVAAANLLAAVHLVAGDFSDALRCCGDNFNGNENRTARDAYGSAEPRDAAAANNAAVVRLLAGANAAGATSPSRDLARAKKLWLEANAARGNPSDQLDAHVALAEYNLGAVALYQPRYEQAETLLTTALAAWQKPTDLSARIGLAINWNALAQLDLAEGAYGRAESRRRAAETGFAVAAADDPSRTAFQCTLAELDVANANDDRAIGLLRKLVRPTGAAGTAAAPSPPYLAILTLRLADALLQAGQNAEAQSSATEAEAMLEHCGLAASRPAADALRIAALAALRQGNQEQAERQFQRAMKILRPADETDSAASSLQTQAVRPPSLEFAELLAAQGELAADLQNYAAATDDYHQALDQLDLLFESKAAGHPLRADYLHSLAMVFVREDKPGEAKPLLQESLAIDRQALPPAHPATIAVMQDLAAVLEKTGSASQADELRSNAEKLRSQTRSQADGPK